MWHRWSRFVQKHAWLLTIVGLAIVLALALPVLVAAPRFRRRRQRSRGHANAPGLRPALQGIRSGLQRPVPVGDRAAGRRRPHRATSPSCRRAVAATPGVASVSPAITNPAGTTAVMRVYPTTAPQDEATSTLLHHLRSDVIPQAIAGTGVQGLRRRLRGAHRRLREPARPAAPAVHRHRDPA